MSSSLTVGRSDVAVTTAKTLAAADSGIVQNVTATATLTLPAATGLTGLTYTIRNGGSGATDGAITVNVTPNGTDQVVGNGFTAANSKGAVNTTGNGGNDFIRITCDGTSKWYIQDSSGTWTRQP
jgi:hypothetical protein